MSKPNEYDTYIIPPNFIEGGTFFGGLLKLRNTAEALVIVLAIGMPVFSVSALTLTAKIIILCLTALPLGIIALVGINGESLSSFIFLVLKYLCNRRIITRNEEGQDKRKKRKKRKAKSGDDAPKYINPVAEYLPVEKIENGIIYTRDHRYLKIVEVVPINSLLRSAREQRNIIYSFISFLKISPVKMQIKVIAKRADLNRHREIVQREMARETDENCRLLQQDYLTLIDRIGAREATSRRFFMVFEYEAWAGRKRDNEEAEAIASLQTAARTAVNYLKQCGNEVLIPENDDEFMIDTLYHLLCRNTTTSLPDRVRRIVAQYQEKGLESEIDAIPCTEFFAPDSIDFTNGRHICIDGLYYAYLLVPSTGYKAQVPAGWLSLIVNAGDGIDLDMFISRQPKARMVQRLGQQLRINRSKIKDASDTNTDFDDLDGAIRSGYFLKEGLGNNEDFYYLNLLIAVTAPTVDELEWKVNELKKLLVSRDMDVCSCAFHEEQAFLSSLPLVSMEKHLFERSKRNALTTGVASCYPFTSYELSDENGILFGLNKYNNSPVIIDIFDSKVYKNANIAVCGTSGAGKTFLILLMALRMRRKGIQVFMLAPLKGHEFHRACVNTGGEFISISPASKSCINVLEIRKVDKSVEETLDGPGIERSELAAKIQRLHIFFALLIPDMSYEEKQLLDDALIRTYARKGTPPTEDAAASAEPAPAAVQQRDILTLDARGEAETQAQMEDIIWHEIHNAYRTRRMLSGMLSGIERTEAGKTIAIVDYKGFRIVIPLKEMVLDFPADMYGADYNEMILRHQKILNKMLGAEVDLMVKGIDAKSRTVVASRKDAMLKKQQIYYFGKDSDGQYRIYDGRVVEARVIAVAEQVVRVEVFGVETSILARDLSWDWIGDAHDRYAVGDKTLVRVLEIDRTEPEHIRIKADIKSVSGNSKNDNLQKCRIQGKYAGKVTHIHKGVVYIRLSNGANAIAHSCYDRRRPGRKDDVSFAVTHLDEEHGVALGIITRIIKQHV